MKQAHYVQLEKLEHDSGVNMALLLTGAIGIAPEGGEYAEIVKKCILRKTQWTMKLYFIKRELGDIAWYWINSCLVQSDQ